MEIGYGNENRPVDVPGICATNRIPTVEERLIQQKDRLERQLSEVNEALTALQSNPEILKILYLISKVSY